MKNTKPLRILLAEDEKEKRLEYILSLKNVGFRVYPAKSGEEIIELLNSHRKNLFDVILSDTELDYDGDGPDSINLAIKENLIDCDRTLIAGMSSIRSSEDYWKEIAHVYCFYVKYCISDLGLRVKTDLNNFTLDKVGLYRRKL